MNESSTNDNRRVGEGERSLAERVLDSLRAGVVAIDGDLNILFRNRAAAVILGSGQHLDEALQGATSRGDWGRRLAARLTEAQCAQLGKVKFGERILEAELVPLATGEDRARAVVVFTDCTEATAVQGELAHAQRLAAVGEIAARAVHELNNPLDGIQRFLNLAQRAAEGGDADKVRAHIDQARIGLERMARITTDMLDVSRKPGASWERASLGEIVSDALRSVEGLATRHGVRCVARVRECRLPEAHATLLFQVFCNLAKNAIESMADGGGTLTVSSAHTPDSARLRFEDTGPGLPRDADIVFEPFYTSKADRSGSGLGLAICRELLERCGGSITAGSRRGGGSVFEVTLPTAREPASACEADADSAPRQDAGRAVGRG